MRDLVRHLGGVHRWATGFVAGARTEPDGRPQEELVGGWPDDGDLGPWVPGRRGGAVIPPDTAPPDLQCWTFLRLPFPLLHWVLPPSPRDGDPPRRRGGRQRGHGHTVRAGVRGLTASTSCSRCSSPVAGASAAIRRAGRRVSATDADGDWDVVVGPTGVVTEPGGTGTADAAAKGEASDLYQTLWNRPVDGAIDANRRRIAARPLPARGQDPLVTTTRRRVTTFGPCAPG